MITLFILLAAIGWLTSFGVAILHLVTGWRNKDRVTFNDGVILFLGSVVAGFIQGWLLVGVSFYHMFKKWTDKHFE